MELVILLPETLIAGKIIIAFDLHFLKTRNGSVYMVG